jgi:hypothetical protein
MSEAIFDRRTVGAGATATEPGVRPAWAALKALARRWLARWRFSQSIAHLDDRMLEDVGLDANHLGLGERLIRRFVAGGEIWRAGG